MLKKQYYRTKKLDNHARPSFYQPVKSYLSRSNREKIIGIKSWSKSEIWLSQAMMNLTF